MKKRLTYCEMIIILFTILMAGCAQKSTSPSLRVGIPYSDNIQNLNSNYYINWLEKETGIDIIPIEIKQTRCDEYLEAVIDSKADIDVIMFSDDFIPSEDLIEKMIGENRIYKNKSGQYVYMNYGVNKSNKCGQVMWINAEWLKELSLEIPKTTEELEDVLIKFKNYDLNKNGKQDEIALIGSMDNISTNPIYFLLNAFIYADPYNTMHTINNDGEIFVCEEKGFEDGLKYISGLYSKGLFDDRSFYYTHNQLCEIVNSSENLVGAFCSSSIGEVIYQGNPEVMAKYICVLPLSGPEGVENALFVKTAPKYGAVIMQGTENEAYAEILLEKMLLPEASLIARYGEENVDWEYSSGFDVSLYGHPATITTKNYIWNTPQNKHLNGIGPINVPEEYLIGVTWNGINSDLEYIDARAELSYLAYKKESLSNYGYDADIMNAVEENVKKIIRGEQEFDKSLFSWDMLCSDGIDH